VGFLPNEIWRLLGLLGGGGLDGDSEVIIWGRAVAVAVLAAVIAKLVLVPPAALAAVPLVLRLGATGCPRMADALGRPSVLAGLVGGGAALVVGGLLLPSCPRLRYRVLHSDLIHAGEQHRVLALELLPPVEVGHGAGIREASAIGEGGLPSEADKIQTLRRDE